jgi:hypothetical protein
MLQLWISASAEQFEGELGTQVEAIGAQQLVVPTSTRLTAPLLTQSDLGRGESDAPRPRVMLQISSGCKSGMARAGYRSLQDALWNALGKPWDAPEIGITPRAFTRALSQPLRLSPRRPMC